MASRFPPNLLVGTSSWSSSDWCGSFYPDPIEPGKMIYTMDPLPKLAQRSNLDIRSFEFNI
jgi:hypothetical protein